MLQTNKSWELKSRGRLLSALYNEPGLRQYPCVEIPVNVCLFHVDVGLGEKHLADQPQFRFIFDELASVLQFAERDDVGDIRLSLQSRRSDSDEYAINSIVEIVEGKDRNGHKIHLYRCRNNISHIDSNTVESERDLSDKRTLWPRQV